MFCAIYQKTAFYFSFARYEIFVPLQETTIEPFSASFSYLPCTSACGKGPHFILSRVDCQIAIIQKYHIRSTLMQCSWSHRYYRYCFIYCSICIFPTLLHHTHKRIFSLFSIFSFRFRGRGLKDFLHLQTTHIKI